MFNKKIKKCKKCNKNAHRVKKQASGLSFFWCNPALYPVSARNWAESLSGWQGNWVWLEFWQTEAACILAM
jgi:hypothetical protein